MYLRDAVYKALVEAVDKNRMVSFEWAGYELTLVAIPVPSGRRVYVRGKDMGDMFPNQFEHAAQAIARRIDQQGLLNK